MTETETIIIIIIIMKVGDFDLKYGTKKKSLAYTSLHVHVSSYLENGVPYNYCNTEHNK